MAVRTERRREMIAGYLFASPWIVGFVVFTLGPMIASLWLSLTEYNIIDPPRFVGLQNYIRMFTADELFHQTLKVTTKYVLISIPLGLITALGLALLVNHSLVGVVVFRAIYFVPHVLAGVATAFVWGWLLNPDFGVINYYLELWLKRPAPNWFGSEEWVLPAFVLFSLWSAGGSMPVFLAGLQAISPELYEAADLDGANRWQRFWHITLPQLSPTILFNLVTGMIAGWRIFTQVFVLTAGGPNYASLVYVLYLYLNGFSWLRMGYASALAWFLFVVVAAATLLVFRTSARWVYYEAERRG